MLLNTKSIHFSDIFYENKYQKTDMIKYIISTCTSVIQHKVIDKVL